MTITVYSSATCAPCKTILYWLNKKGYKYEYKDIAEHQEEVSQYTNEVFPPVVVVDGQVAKNVTELARLVGA